jgi:hypothetical protein
MAISLSGHKHGGIRRKRLVLTVWLSQEEGKAPGFLPMDECCRLSNQQGILIQTENERSCWKRQL